MKRQVGRLRNKDRLCTIAIVGDCGEYYSLPSVSKGLVSAQDSPGPYWLSEFQNGSGSDIATSKMTALGHATFDLGTACCYVAVLRSLRSL